MMLPAWGKTLNLENERSRRVLSIEYQRPYVTIFDMAESMIESGLI